MNEYFRIYIDDYPSSDYYTARTLPEASEVAKKWRRFLKRKGRSKKIAIMKITTELVESY